MTTLLSYTFSKLQNAGILPSFGIDAPQEKNKEQMSEIVKNCNLKGYICPVYNPDTLEELDEDGSALVFFEVVPERVWEDTISIFERCGYNILYSKTKTKFGIIVSDSEIDVHTTYLQTEVKVEVKKVENEKVENEKVEVKKVEVKKVEVKKVEVKKVEVNNEKKFKKIDDDSLRRTPKEFWRKFSRWPKRDLLVIIGRLSDEVISRTSKAAMVDKTCQLCSAHVMSGGVVDFSI